MRPLRVVLLLCCSLVATVPHSGAQGRTPRVLLLGDSISTGYGLAERDAFPARLLRLARLAGRPFLLAVDARDGMKVADGAARVRRSVFVHRPDVVVLALGGNDVLSETPLDALAVAVEQLVAGAGHRGARVLLAGVEVPSEIAGPYHARFGDIFAAAAARHGAAYLPSLLEGVAGYPRYNQLDFVHPNARGAERIARHVWTALDSLLTPPADRPGYAVSPFRRLPSP